MWRAERPLQVQQPQIQGKDKRGKEGGRERGRDREEGDTREDLLQEEVHSPYRYAKRLRISQSQDESPWPGSITLSDTHSSRGL